MQPLDTNSKADLSSSHQGNGQIYTNVSLYGAVIKNLPPIKCRALFIKMENRIRRYRTIFESFVEGSIGKTQDSKDFVLGDHIEIGSIVQFYKGKFYRLL